MTADAKRAFKLSSLFATGLLVAFIVPTPEGLAAADWKLLVLFLTTVAGVVWQPFPVSIVVLTSLAIGGTLGLMSVQQFLEGFSNSVTWIIVAAFLFARAFVKTGLGRRIALLFIRSIGKNSMMLGYALALTDLLLSPVTASNTARGGAIVFPLARSLAGEFDSEAGPTSRRIGAYLLLTAYQTNVVTSAMFLTAMAANALCVELARQVAGVEITWELWAAAASVPGLLSFLVLPWFVHRVYPPEIKETKKAQIYASNELRKLGPVSRHERMLGLVFLVLAATWATSSVHGISTVAAALTALCVLIVLGILDVDELAGEKAAWMTFIWFGGMLSLAGALTDGNLITWFVQNVESMFAGGQGLQYLILLALGYFYLHYAFVSMTAQIIALYGAFLATALALQAPPLLSALLLCFFSNLYASLTHYADGAAPIFYGSGYIEQGDWWRVGFLLSLVNLTIWLGVGLPWWSFLGIW